MYTKQLHSYILNKFEAFNHKRLKYQNHLFKTGDIVLEQSITMWLIVKKKLVYIYECEQNVSQQIEACYA